MELRALLKHALHLLVGHNSLVQLLEELALRRVLQLSAQQLLEGRRLLTDRHGKLLALGLKLLNLGKVGHVLLAVLVEHSLLLHLLGVNLHQLLHSVQVVVHGNTLGHALLLGRSDVVNVR